MILHYGYCHVLTASLKASPSHISEQVSELLFGEQVEILEADDRGWAKIRCKWDGYEGWCRLSQLSFIDKKSYARPQKYISIYPKNKILFADEERPLPLGAEWQRPTIQTRMETVKYKGNKMKFEDIAPSRELLKSIAFHFKYAPYLWGGRTVWGIDCSGFTQMIYKLSNIRLLRDASQQATQGSAVDFLQNAQTGDLAFFDNQEGHINHVGMLLDKNTIIHATDTAGCVVIDKIDQGGIISAFLKKRTHNLRLVRRYF